PNDEPASVLLEKIRAEKARLIKEGKIKKDKKESLIYRGEDNSYYEKFADGKVVCIDDEIPFEVPESWQWERWGNLSYSIQYGYNAPAEEAGDIRMVRISDIQDGEVLWATVPFCHINKSEIDTYLLQKDDILFARTGGTVGKSFLVNDVPYPSIYAGYLIRTRYSNMLSAQYMKYFMECELYWEQLRHGTIATAQPNCNGKTLAKMILPIPPYNEQIRITESLNQLLEQVRKYGESQDRLDKLNIQIHDLLKKSILQEAIQGKLVPQDASEEPALHLIQRIKEEKLRLVKEGKLKKKDVIDSTIFRGDDNKYYEQIGQEIKDVSEELPFEIPANWEWCRLRDLCLIFTGATFRKDEAKIDCKGVRILRGGNILPFEIIQKTDDIFLSPEQVKEDILLKQNDIITPAVTSLENIGKMARVGQDMPNVTVGGFVFLIRPHYSDEWLSKFLLFFMSSPSAIEFMKSITNKSGQAFYNIGKERLATTLVPIPPKDEERRIVVKIEDLFDRIKGN
ncbi:MAG: restriction endonuclease subunit S, partial [Aeriscardovia sp.]|nr:restriction endonuclease subunit S [Aeriscardovia sp.]